MKGKIAIITGANSGIGFETAKALAQKGAVVGMVARKAQRSDDARQAIITQTGNEKVFTFYADLSLQSDIREAASQIKNKFDRVDVLVNNAGTWFSQRIITAEGKEMMFAVNHLAYVLMSHLLIGHLEKSAGGRIINVASDSHFRAKLKLDDLFLSKGYHGLKAYEQSKLANILFTYELAKRVGERPILVNAVQPGLVKTNIGHKNTIGLHSIAWWIRKLGGVSPEKGAETSIYLASSDEGGKVSGKYWDKCKPKSSSKSSYDEKMAAALWDQCLNLTGIEDFFSAD